MTHGEGTPGWATLERVAGDLYDQRSPLAALTDDQLMRWIEAGRRGEPDPPDVLETLRAAMKRTRLPAWLAAMTDHELSAYLDREAALLRAEHGHSERLTDSDED